MSFYELVLSEKERVKQEKREEDAKRVESVLNELTLEDFERSGEDVEGIWDGSLTLEIKPTCAKELRYHVLPNTKKRFLYDGEWEEERIKSIVKSFCEGILRKFFANKKYEFQFHREYLPSFRDGTLWIIPSETVEIERKEWLKEAEERKQKNQKREDNLVSLFRGALTKKREKIKKKILGLVKQDQSSCVVFKRIDVDFNFVRPETEERLSKVLVEEFPDFKGFEVKSVQKKDDREFVYLGQPRLKFLYLYFHW